MTAAWVIAFCALWVFVLVLGLVLLGLLRRIAPVLETAERAIRQYEGTAIDGLPVGAMVPDFSAETTSGEKVGAAELRGAGAVFVLMKEGCTPCDILKAEMRRIGELGMAAPLILIGEAGAGGYEELPAGARVVFQREREVFIAFETQATPVGFAIDGNGEVVASRVVNNIAALRTLARRLKDKPASQVRTGAAGENQQPVKDALPMPSGNV